MWGEGAGIEVWDNVDEDDFAMFYLSTQCMVKKN